MNTPSRSYGVSGASTGVCSQHRRRGCNVRRAKSASSATSPCSLHGPRICGPTCACEATTGRRGGTGQSWRRSPAHMGRSSLPSAQNSRGPTSSGCDEVVHWASGRDWGCWVGHVLSMGVRDVMRAIAVAYRSYGRWVEDDVGQGRWRCVSATSERPRSPAHRYRWIPLFTGGNLHELQSQRTILRRLSSLRRSVCVRHPHNETPQHPRGPQKAPRGPN